MKSKRCCVENEKKLRTDRIVRRRCKKNRHQAKEKGTEAGSTAARAPPRARPVPRDDSRNAQSDSGGMPSSLIFTPAIRFGRFDDVFRETFPGDLPVVVALCNTGWIRLWRPGSPKRSHVMLDGQARRYFGFFHPSLWRQGRHELLVSQGLERSDSRRPPSRRVGGTEHDEREYGGRCCGQRSRIESGEPVQQRLGEACEDDSSDSARHDTYRGDAYYLS